MAVETVEAGIGFGAREPATVDTGFGVEHLVGGLEPVQSFRLRLPECLGVTHP
ncbi:hypothetical protein D3C72_1946690 [compost metagenome]